MPRAWTDTLDKKLLLACMNANECKIKNWDKVTDLMGEGYTNASCQQRFAKVKAMVEKSGQDDSVSSTVAKPVASRKKAVSKRKEVNLVNNEGDEEFLPTKKARILKKEGLETNPEPKLELELKSEEF